MLMLHGQSHVWLMIDVAKCLLESSCAIVSTHVVPRFKNFLKLLSFGIAVWYSFYQLLN